MTFCAVSWDTFGPLICSVLDLVIGIGGMAWPQRHSHSHTLQSRSGSSARGRNTKTDSRTTSAFLNPAFADRQSLPQRPQPQLYLIQPQPIYLRVIATIAAIYSDMEKLSRIPLPTCRRAARKSLTSKLGARAILHSGRPATLSPHTHPGLYVACTTEQAHMAASRVGCSLLPLRHSSFSISYHLTDRCDPTKIVFGTGPGVHILQLGTPPEAEALISTRNELSQLRPLSHFTCKP